MAVALAQVKVVALHVLLTIKCQIINVFKIANFLVPPAVQLILINVLHALMAIFSTEQLVSKIYHATLTQVAAYAPWDTFKHSQKHVSNARHK